MSVNRRVVKPEVVQRRIDAQNANNVWNYVTAINARLETTAINSDLSIIVNFYWTIDQSMIDQILEIYTGVGWLVEIGITEGRVKTYPGETIFEFRPPA